MILPRDIVRADASGSGSSSVIPSAFTITSAFSTGSGTLYTTSTPTAASALKYSNGVSSSSAVAPTSTPSAQLDSDSKYTIDTANDSQSQHDGIGAVVEDVNSDYIYTQGTPSISISLNDDEQAVSSSTSGARPSVPMRTLGRLHIGLIVIALSVFVLTV